MTERDLPSRADLDRVLIQQDESKRKAVDAALAQCFHLDTRRRFTQHFRIFTPEVEDAIDSGNLPVVDLGEAGKWLPHWALSETHLGFELDGRIGLLWERARHQRVSAISFINVLVAPADSEHPEAGSYLDAMLMGQPDGFSILEGVVDRINVRVIDE